MSPAWWGMPPALLTLKDPKFVVGVQRAASFQLPPAVPAQSLFAGGVGYETR